MPSGVHSNHRGGPPRRCFCDTCKICKRRQLDQRLRLKKKQELLGPSDAELERRLVDKFKKEGWD